MLERLRCWARKYTDAGRYSPVGVTFHWLMAALILFQIGYGFWTDVMMPGGGKLRAYEVHAAIGLLILLLAMLRGVWRILIPGPINDADRLGMQTRLAHATHFLFYVCFLGLPLSGWVMWSSIAPAGGLRLGGVLPWPLLPFDALSAENRFAALQVAEQVHRYLVILLLVLIPAHVAAALKHHFWDRHDVLQGMLPDIPDWEDPQAATQKTQPEPRFPQGSEVG